MRGVQRGHLARAHKRLVLVHSLFDVHVNRDIEELSDLMAENYCFINPMGGILEGKKSGLEAWRDFFSKYPDYQNHFKFLESKDNLVFILGFSTCKFDSLDGPAIWTAKVEDDLISEWHVCADTEENRRKLRLRG